MYKIDTRSPHIIEDSKQVFEIAEQEGYLLLDRCSDSLIQIPRTVGYCCTTSLKSLPKKLLWYRKLLYRLR
jgi:hypothetical protein